MLDEPREIHQCCDEEACTSGVRNRYFVGKRLSPDAFRVEQEYHIGRRRLLNRAIHGWGVVYGYAMGDRKADGSPAPTGTLVVGAGLALDRAGRELLQSTERLLTYTQLTVLPDRPATAQAQANSTSTDACWLLRVHYAERQIGPMTLRDPCDCARQEWNEVCEDVWYSLQRWPCEECCAGEPCELCCDCCRDCDDPPSVHNRGPHRCLCDHLTHLHPYPETETLCEVAKGVRADLHNGVPLACVTLARDECGCWQLGPVREACGPRRLVKRNDLLFDLVRGCDLAHISDISWAPWHRREPDAVPWKEFADFFDGDDVDEGRVTKFWVRFSRPVRAETLKPDCFAITVTVPEERSGWGEVRRLPITGLKVTSESIDPPGTARVVSLIVDYVWWHDEVRDPQLDSRAPSKPQRKPDSIFRDNEALVEIEIRGDYILDCAGQPIDANPVGRRATPTGNGTPGGTFLSTFRVAPEMQVVPPAAHAA